MGEKTKSAFHLTAFGDKGWLQHTVDSGTSYYDGMLVYMETLRTGKWPLSADELLEPVKILTAIKRSLETHWEVSLGNL